MEIFIIDTILFSDVGKDENLSVWKKKQSTGIIEENIRH